MPGDNMTATGMAETSGPNASLDFGQATKMKDLVRQGGGLATGGSPIAAPPGGGQQSPLPQKQQAEGGPPQMQPQPAPPAAGQPFALPQPHQDTEPWRRRLVQWGNHPGNYDSLKAIARLSQMDHEISGLYRTNHARHQQGSV
jgi:hypothetical protein